MSFSIETEELRPGLLSMQPWQVGSEQGPVPLSWDRACTLLQEHELRRALIDALCEVPFEAYFWECVPVCARTRETPLHWIVQESPTLAGVSADEHSFREHLAPGEQVTGFWNLGGDALLIAPSPGEDPQARAHLASFVRSAPRDQVEALFAAVGRETRAHLERSNEPLWVSTSGLGVYWLHVRLDRRPKYYTYAPYRQMP